MSLVLVTAMALSVTALAGYVQTSLRSERATATQVKRLSAADGALRLAVESLKRSSANCTSSMNLPALNGTQVTVRCVGNGLPTATWTRHDLTATVRSPEGGVSTGRATVQLSGVATPCTSSCTVTVNAWLIE
jgi:type II secretory pathway component PulK